MTAVDIPAIRALIAEARTLHADWKAEMKKRGKSTDDSGVIPRLADALDTLLALAPEPATEDERAENDRLRAKETESEWEYGEFDSYDLQPDGTLIEWAEPKDSWDEPLSPDELAELRAEGGVYARRPKPLPWEPVVAGDPDE